MLMPLNPDDYINNIIHSKLKFNDHISNENQNLFIPNQILELILNNSLIGMNVSYPNRTRSKIIKQAICQALGYPIPTSFPKTNPRFIGQNFDIYNQKSHNVQIWNEEISPTRRYVIVGINNEDKIFKIKVINGSELARFDETGTITIKYQASFSFNENNEIFAELISTQDSESLLPYISNSPSLSQLSPISNPQQFQLLSIHAIYECLSRLIGTTFSDPGVTQERARGAKLHQLVCKALGYQDYADNGQFPDIRHQLLEIKLQTSPTIDLGSIFPNQIDYSGITIQNTNLRYCDTRYAIFYGVTNGINVTLTHLVVCTGRDFFLRFRQLQGNIINGKLQIPLPANFFY